MTLLISGGTVVDRDGERRADVLVDGDVIAAVGLDIAAEASMTTLDASGCFVAPGFVDLHAHLREPGREDAETIETGSRAAALGGYTAVVAMPNTDPPADARSVVEFVRDAGGRAGTLRRVPERDASPSDARGEQLRPVRRARRRRRPPVHRRRHPVCRTPC